MKWRLLCMLALAALPAAAQSDRSMTAPIGGWNRAGATDQSEQPTVNYPYSLIFRGAQRGRRMIEGELTQAGKTGGHTLVVNGNPTPLYADDNRRYARAYAFGSGSNSVEVRSADRKPARRVHVTDARRVPGLDQLLGQFRRAGLLFRRGHAPTPGHHQPHHAGVLRKHRARTARAIHCSPCAASASSRSSKPSPTDIMNLRWLALLLLPSCAFGQVKIDTPRGGWRNSAGAGEQYVTTGYGPEIFSSAAPFKGQYLVYVNYYGSGADTSTLTVAQVTIITNENTAREKRQSFMVPMRAQGELTMIKSFVLP